MAEHPDPYGTWGDWTLEQFAVEVPRWRDTEHPPKDVFDLVDHWWPCLKQRVGRVGAIRVSRAADPRGNLWWMWVPRAEWLDEEKGYFRVQCYFRVYELARPPRVVCDGIRSVRALTPSQVDRADGMG